MTVEDIDNHDTFNKVIQSNELVAVDFFAQWCGPCKVISPIFKKLSEQYPEIKFVKVDVDENSETAQELSISAMPTFIFFKHGKQIDEIIGANPRGIEESLKNLLK